jgi:hypothetical protein
MQQPLNTWHLLALCTEMRCCYGTTQTVNAASGGSRAAGAVAVAAAAIVP